LARLYEAHRDRRLVEPFAGGLAATLALRPRQALLNDINGHLINFYRWLKRGLVVPIPLDNEEAAYYCNRDRFNELLLTGLAETDEAASLFYYLNRTGYNGLCRFNRQGLLNVPFGRHRIINYIQDFTPYRTALRQWTFENRDFERLKIQPSDFIYADPPYDVEFTQYAPENFTWADQVRLANWLATHKGPVVLSNQATPRIVKLYRKLGFKLRFLDAPRMINCTGDRTPAREVLAQKNI
jgi:DNA adenine methylase